MIYKIFVYTICKMYAKQNKILKAKIIEQKKKLYFKQQELQQAICKSGP